MSDESSVSSTPYRVLARKYRPTDFSTLIGQDALVRTLTNAISTGRLAHAFVLTGVRGVGKTTTARIIARALNCIGPDGTGGPTVTPCGICPQCQAIAEDRHVDVLEMDAASRTGVNDIRELIDGVRYRPVSARFKIYIIDEVHMLSTQAFNALLKTLEEPPEHVKFIFATTEIRKIPITVLSRCQRFDLRRVEMDVLQAHFSRISGLEGADIAPGALALLARAADGSVRDGLSLLDQAIAHGAGQVSEAQVRDMLGLADRARVYDLFEAVLRGKIADALDQLAGQYAVGADPAVILQDMLELTHWLTRLKVSPDAAAAQGVPETERVRGATMAQSLQMSVLTRCWQMLLKGLSEVRQAPSPIQAAEMLLIRMAYAAELPSPAEAIEALRTAPPGGSARPGGGGGSGSPEAGAAQGGGGAGGGISRAQMLSASFGAPVAAPVTMQAGRGGAAAVSFAAPQPEDSAPVFKMPADFAALAALFSERREGVIAAALRGSVHLVHYEPGRVEFRPDPSAPKDLAGRMNTLLRDWTGRSWLISVSNGIGQPTLLEQEGRATEQRKRDAAEDPLVKAVLLAFPGAFVETVRDFRPQTQSGDDAADGNDPATDDGLTDGAGLALMAEFDLIAGDDEE